MSAPSHLCPYKARSAHYQIPHPCPYRQYLVLYTNPFRPSSVLASIFTPRNRPLYSQQPLATSHSLSKRINCWKRLAQSLSLAPLLSCPLIEAARRASSSSHELTTQRHSHPPADPPPVCTWGMEALRARGFVEDGSWSPCIDPHWDMIIHASPPVKPTIGHTFFAFRCRLSLPSYNILRNRAKQHHPFLIHAVKATTVHCSGITRARLSGFCPAGGLERQMH